MTKRKRIFQRVRSSSGYYVNTCFKELLDLKEALVHFGEKAPRLFIRASKSTCSEFNKKWHGTEIYTDLKPVDYNQHRFPFLIPKLKCTDDLYLSMQIMLDRWLNEYAEAFVFCYIFNRNPSFFIRNPNPYFFFPKKKDCLFLTPGKPESKNLFKHGSSFFYSKILNPIKQAVYGLKAPNLKFFDSTKMGENTWEWESDLNSEEKKRLRETVEFAILHAPFYTELHNLEIIPKKPIRRRIFSESELLEFHKINEKMRLRPYFRYVEKCNLQMSRRFQELCKYKIDRWGNVRYVGDHKDKKKIYIKPTPSSCKLLNNLAIMNALLSMCTVPFAIIYLYRNRYELITKLGEKMDDFEKKHNYSKKNYIQQSILLHITVVRILFSIYRPIFFYRILDNFSDSLVNSILLYLDAKARKYFKLVNIKSYGILGFQVIRTCYIIFLKLKLINFFSNNAFFNFIGSKKNSLKKKFLKLLKKK